MGKAGKQKMENGGILVSPFERQGFPPAGNPFLSSQRSPRDSLEEPCPRCSGWLSAGFTSILPDYFSVFFIKMSIFE